MRPMNEAERSLSADNHLPVYRVARTRPRKNSPPRRQPLAHAHAELGKVKARAVE